MSETGGVTSELMWRAALVTALIDGPLLFLIARRASSGLFYRLKWYLAGAAFVVYALLWGTFGSLWYWDTVYQAIFPAWAHWLLPVYGLLYAVLALAFWRVSLLAARRQAVCFILLGGLLSLVGHSIGISRGLLRVPLLAEVSAASALTFGVFEYIFYWCAIVGLAIAAQRMARGLRGWKGCTPNLA